MQGDSRLVGSSQGEAPRSGTPRHSGGAGDRTGTTFRLPARPLYPPSHMLSLSFGCVEAEKQKRRRGGLSGGLTLEVVLDLLQAVHGAAGVGSGLGLVCPRGGGRPREARGTGLPAMPLGARRTQEPSV